MDKWRGKIAVVTGASSGIGEAITEALLANGVHVAGLARRKERVEAIATRNKDKPGKLYAVECDVTKPESIEKAFEWIERTLGGVDILVNNAGIVKYGNVFDLTKPLADYLVTIDTNLTGLFMVSRAAYKTMQNREFGYIVNINSIVGQISADNFDVLGGLNLYKPSKHGVTQLTQIMKLECANSKKNIRVTSISPGAVRTDIDVAANLQMADGKTRIWDTIPCMEPSDIADQVVYLLSTKPSVNISEVTIEAAGMQYFDTKHLH